MSHIVCAKVLVEKLKRWDHALFEKASWLVLSKIDWIPEEERDAMGEYFKQQAEASAQESDE
jgi:GTPase involved in cell partitioning and DNA repair